MFKNSRIIQIKYKIKKKFTFYKKKLKIFILFCFFLTIKLSYKMVLDCKSTWFKLIIMAYLMYFIL